jgi:inner membrane protease ATP23
MSEDTKLPEKEPTPCRKFLDHTLPESKKIKTLFESMTKLRCNFDPKTIKCVPCSSFENFNGGYVVDFSADEGSEKRTEILLCENKLKTLGEVENVLIHEMIHAYDDCRAFIDPEDCRHFACMEIRASYNSGECHYFPEVRRGNYALLAGNAQCARRRAVLSLKMSEKCAKDAEMWVSNAWDVCAKDHEPFESVDQ